MAWSYSDWPMGWMVQGLNLRRDKSLFSFLKHLHQGWGPPPSLIHNGYQTKHLGHDPGFHLHLGLRVGMSGDISLLPHMPPLCRQGQILLSVLFNYLWFSNNAVRCSDTTASDNGMISENCSGGSLEVTMP
jgi:hypothetical protein